MSLKKNLRCCELNDIQIKYFLRYLSVLSLHQEMSTVEADCIYSKGSTVLGLAQNGNEKKHWQQFRQ